MLTIEILKSLLNHPTNKDLLLKNICRLLVVLFIVVHDGLIFFCCRAFMVHYHNNVVKTDLLTQNLNLHDCIE